MREWRTTTTRKPRAAGVGAVLGASVLAALAFAPHAGADAGWSRTPGSGLPGATVRVASSSTTLCQWLAPAEPVVTVPDAALGPAGTAEISAEAVGDPIIYDGTTVEIRLDAEGITTTLGVVEVTPGGAWSGSVAVPLETATGEYEMLARCIVDHPDLDGVRSFDFDPLTFTVVDAPPPTTITIPTEIDTPATATNPVQVQGTGTARSTVASANRSTPVATLPNTGDGTVGVALAGIGALVLGAAALWWGTRPTANTLS